MPPRILWLSSFLVVTAYSVSAQDDWHAHHGYSDPLRSGYPPLSAVDPYGYRALPDHHGAYCPERYSGAHHGYGSRAAACEEPGCPLARGRSPSHNPFSPRLDPMEVPHRHGATDFGHGPPHRFGAPRRRPVFPEDSRPLSRPSLSSPPRFQSPERPSSLGDGSLGNGPPPATVPMSNPSPPRFRPSRFLGQSLLNI